MTNDDLITVRTFIDANAPSIVKDAFEIICKDTAEALKPSHNTDYAAALSRLKGPEIGQKSRAWNEAIDACIEELQRLNSSTNIA